MILFRQLALELLKPGLEISDLVILCEYFGLLLLQLLLLLLERTETKTEFSVVHSFTYSSFYAMQA